MLTQGHRDYDSIFRRDLSDLSLADKMKRVAAFVPASAAGAIALNSLAVLLVYIIAGTKTSEAFDVFTAAIGAGLTCAALLFRIDHRQKK